MKHSILILSLILFATSCTTQRRCNRLFPPERWQSTEIETTFKPHLVTLRSVHELLKDSKPVYIDTTGKFNSERSRLETEFAVSEAWVSNNQLYHWLNQKDVERVDTVLVPYTVIKHEKGEIREVNRLYWWQKVLMVIGAITFVGFGYWVFRQFRLGR